MNYSEFIDSLSSSYRNQLSKLTSASSESAPGYLYRELVEYIKTDLSKLNDIEDYLINKLSRKEPYIKIKCLKLLKQLCTNFPNDFIRPKVTQSQAVLDCKNYRTPASEYNGDYLSKLVRNEFEELIKVVCSYDSLNNNTAGTSENKMVGFGNNQYTGQTSNYQAPGYPNPAYNNPNPNYGNPNQGFGNPALGYNNPNPNPSYGSHANRNMPSYGNSGMMGFGNPNMPRTQHSNSNSFSSFASNFTPTVSELKSAGNNALKLISYAANKYIPSDIRDKIEKVGTAITSTATEQIEKYLGGRNPMERGSSNILNNSMYNNRGFSGNYQPGFGLGHNAVSYAHGSVSSSYNPAGYNSVGYGSQPPYPNQPSYNPQPFVNQQQASAIGYNSVSQPASSASFSNQQSFTHTASFNQPPMSHSSSYNQPFDPFPKQQPSVEPPSKTSSVQTLASNPEPSVDLLSTAKSSSKYQLPGEREAAFVKEMLTFTGIKVSPSPRLIDEYMAKMRDMDKKLIVEELLKHLNVRSTKWQTHFRILCIFESLFQKANLDSVTLDDLRKTAVPIFNKCKEEAQLANKASKLLSVLSSLSGSAPVSEVSDFFSSNTTDLFSSSSPRAATSQSLGSSHTPENMLEPKTEDLFSNKTEPVNPAFVPVGSNMDEFDLFFSSTNSLQSTDRDSKPAYNVSAKSEEKRDLFDFDSLSFSNPTQSVAHEVPAQSSHQPIASNIDNNLDLFDNTDFNADMLTGKPSEPFQPFEAKANPKAETFDLI